METTYRATLRQLRVERTLVASFAPAPLWFHRVLVLFLPAG